MLQQQHLQYFRLKEKDILTYIRKYLRYGGWYVIRIHQGLGSHRGISDLICVKDGVVIFVECKSAKGRLSQDQQTFAENIKKHGGIYLLVRSIDDLVEQLESKGIKA